MVLIKYKDIILMLLQEFQLLKCIVLYLDGLLSQKKCRALLHQLDMKNVHVQVTLNMTDIYLSLPHLYVCKKYFSINYLNKYYSPPLSVFQEKLRKVTLLSCSQQTQTIESKMKQRCSSIDSIPSHISQRRLIFQSHKSNTKCFKEQI